ncbi:MAG: hypothetical protein K2Q18_15330 [Bdellovibrionales bacterium]|nr:hypothetical protein [Bdellovibrionales bacterium]
MLEGIAMCVTLVAMGIYFIKSTDIPKDMRDRSAQMKSQTPEVASSTAKKYSFPVDKNKMEEIQVKKDKLAMENQLERESKILEMKKRERQALQALHNKKIDEITLLITALEQELKENNERNDQIQAEINRHLDTLRILKETVIA